MGKNKFILRQLARLPIVFYQIFFRPIMRPSCRFYPSCSDYALSAVEQHGVVKGFKLAVCRLLRCHPWADGGFDPVSSKKEKP